MTRILSLLVVMAGTASAAPRPSFVDEAKASDVVVVGKLVKVGPAPLFLSGLVMAIQTLTYDVDTVLRGSEKRKQIEVRYIIVGGASYVAATAPRGMPEVAPALAKIGDRYIVAESRLDKELFAVDAERASAADISAIMKP